MLVEPGQRKIRSFVLRQGRFSPAQQRAFDELWPRFGLDYTAAERDYDAIFKRSAPRVVENFLDLAHFGFVHEGWLGSRDATSVPAYEVQMTPTGVLATGCKAVQPRSSVHATASAMVEYSYEVIGPYTAVLTKVPEAGSAWFLPRIVGLPQSLRWCYSGRVFDAAEAARGGLIEEPLAPEALLPKAMEIAREYAGDRLVSVLEGGYDLEGLASAAGVHVRRLADVR